MKHLTMRMKKSTFINMVKQKIEEKTFEDLEKKKSVYKVEKMEHNILRIQKYLQPSKIQINKEEAQVIFKLRCRVTEAKVNLKGKYVNLECRACGQEEENQEHILKCKELNKNKNMEELNYKHLFNGNVGEKLKISKLFKQNFKTLEYMKNR